MPKMPRTARKAMSAKIAELRREGYPGKQATAIGYSEYRKGGVRRLKKSHAGKVSGRKRR